jgi:uncharacterized protein YndB with AHSA1/START domain
VAGKNSIDLAGDPRVIAGTRVFAAPRALVFSAFTDPRHLAQWWGPDGFSLTTGAFEFRPGGVWRFVMHGPDGRDYQNRVIFDEIVPNARIAYRHDDGSDDADSIKFQTVVTFDDDAAGTAVTWRATFPDADARAFVIREHGADKGLLQTMARLDRYLATGLKTPGNRSGQHTGERR